MKLARTYRSLAFVAALLAGLFAVTTLFAAGDAESSAERSSDELETVSLEVGYMPILPVAQLFIMEGEGWTDEAGLDLNLIRFQNGPAMVQALASGRLDVMFFGIGPALVAKGRGQDITVVASNIVEQIGLIARETLADYWQEDDPSAVFADFEAGEGRKAKIATFPQGSVPDIVLRFWLQEQLGIGFDAVEIVPMGADQVQQALLAGSVDGASILEPVLTIVQERDPSTRVLTRADAMFPGQPGAVLAVRSEIIEENPGAVQRLVDLHVRATEYLRTNIEGSARHAVEFIGAGLVDQATIGAALRSPSTNYMADPREILEPTRRMHDFQLETGSLAAPVDLDEFFDTSFYESAVE
ncbi:MAG: ABC transporter substrate-binding protein [Spirochaetota bacterium]